MAVTWTQLPDFPGNAYGTRVCAISGLVCCQLWDSASKTATVYTLADGANEWVTGPSLSNTYQGGGFLVVNGTDIYTVVTPNASPYTPVVYKFDPVNGTLTEHYNPGNYLFQYTGTTSTGPIAYLYAPNGGTGATKAFTSYDPATNTTTGLAVPGGVINSNVPALASNGHVFLTGYNAAGTTEGLWDYDPSANTWSWVQGPDVDYNHPAVTQCAPGTLLFSTGSLGSGSGIGLYEYDVTAQTFTEVTNYPVYPAYLELYANNSNGVYAGVSHINASGYPGLYFAQIGPYSASGGSAAHVTVTAAGGGTGTEAGSGGSSASVTVTATGGGKAFVPLSGGSSASVTVTATGGGKPFLALSGGSVAHVLVTAAGAGRAADTVQGGSTVHVLVTATGGGKITAGISGAVQDFPDWVPPHIIIATDNVIYTSPAAGDRLPFRPTFVGLGGWTTVVATVLGLTTAGIRPHSIILEWTSAGTVVATIVVDMFAAPPDDSVVRGAQITMAARSDELRVTIPAVTDVDAALFTLAGTTRTVPESITPADFPGGANYAAGPTTASIDAAGSLTLYAGPYTTGSRLVLATDQPLTATAARYNGAAGESAPYPVQSWDVTDTPGGPLYVPAAAGITRWQLDNAGASAASITYYVEDGST